MFRALRGAALAASFLVCHSGGFSATAVYAVTRGGSLYRSTDSGKSWQQIPLPGVTPAMYSAAVAVDPQDPAKIYVALYDRTTGAARSRAFAAAPVRSLLRSTDGGQNWTDNPLPASVSPAQLVVDPAAPSTLYMGTASRMYRSTDSGATFNVTGPPLAILKIAPDPNQAGVVYGAALTNQGPELYKSTDYGATWSSAGFITVPNFRLSKSTLSLVVDPHNANILYVPTNETTCPATAATCGMLKSTDGGKSWAAAGATGAFNDVAIDPQSGAIYASGLLPAAGRAPATGHVARSTDGGKTWTALDSGLSTYAVQVLLDPNANSTLYGVPVPIGTVPLGMFTSTNSGGAWTMNSVASAVVANDAILSVAVSSGGPAAPPPPAPTGSVTRTVSAASLQDGPVAAESIVIATGLRLATDSATADYDQPPTRLAGTSVNVTDSAGVTRPAALFKVSPTQVTYQIPPGTASGTATVVVTAGDGLTATVQVQIAAVAPGVYTLNAAGLVRAYAVRHSKGNVFIEDVFDIDGTGAVVARPINISNGDEVHLIAYGTGFRAAGGDVGATIGGISAPLLYAGPQGVQPGIDQFTILIPPELSTGSAQSVQIVLTASGQAANTVNVTVQ